MSCRGVPFLSVFRCMRKTFVAVRGFVCGPGCGAKTNVRQRYFHERGDAGWMSMS